MTAYFETRDLSVGYNGETLIKGINIALERGQVLSLIGPNGAGKSTILKTITGQLRPISGAVLLEGEDMAHMRPKQLSKKLAVALTQHIRPELMSCAELVAMGRYPYTGLFGRLTAKDKAAVREALELVQAFDIAEQQVSTLSDGQLQRVMLARALCQEPELLVLDEPTAYLDIKHKILLLDMLRDLAREKRLTVIMSLHEIDLAMKASDMLLCVRSEQIQAFGPPEKVVDETLIPELYDMESGSYDVRYGSVELGKPKGEPRLFVLAGGGRATACYRALQKRQIPFATGILSSNDLDYPVAMALSDKVIAVPAFQPVTKDHFEEAARQLSLCTVLIDTSSPLKGEDSTDSRLLALAKKQGLAIYSAAELEKGNYA